MRFGLFGPECRRTASTIADPLGEIEFGEQALKARV